MCDTTEWASATAVSRGVSRRRMLGTVAATAATVAAGTVVGASPAAAASQPDQRLSVTLLGTAGGPPPVAGRLGISSALVVNGKTYVIDCGRGSLSQFVAAGLSLPSLAGIFLTHLHADHTVDYFSYPLLAGGAAGTSGFTAPIDVYGPISGGVPTGTPPAGQTWVLPDAPSPGTSALTTSANLAFAQSSDFFMQEHFGINPASVLTVHEIAPPASAGASPTDPAPTMTPFTVLENDDLKVTAILVAHGAVFPAYAYRFDTEHGSVVFSGDTAPTPNIPTLAYNANLLVHEAMDLAVLETTGLSPALLQHIATVHTDISHLGAIAAEAEVGGIAATHFSPADPGLMSTADWTRRLRASARSAGYRGQLTVGADLLRVPVPR